MSGKSGVSAPPNGLCSEGTASAMTTTANATDTAATCSSSSGGGGGVGGGGSTTGGGSGGSGATTRTRLYKGGTANAGHSSSNPAAAMPLRSLLGCTSILE